MSLSEDSLHLAAADLLRLNFPQDAVFRHGVCWTTIEHRNARNAIEGAKRKARGVKPGIPDLDFVCHGKSYRIELKTPDGALSKDQILERARYIAAGGQWALCRSPEDVQSQLRAWGFVLRARLAA